MGPLGWQETVFIFVLALLIFGPKKLPELGKTLGKAMTEFRRASTELRSTWEREMAAVERESESLKQTTSNLGREITSAAGVDSYYNSDANYEYGYDSEYDYTEPSNTSSTVGASAPQDAEQTAAAAQTEGGETTPAPESGKDQASTGSEPARS